MPSNEDLREMRRHLHEVAQQNVYFRRFMHTLPVPTDKETRRVYMLATQREVSEALGYLWQMERTMAKMLPAIRDIQVTLDETMKHLTPADDPV
jgi:hypothetical protein